jgi:uncharacterized membrane protein (DUF485 family)
MINKGRCHMSDEVTMNWDKISRDPRFQTLHRRKQGFLWGMMVFAVAFYLLLPIGAAYFQDFFKIRVWGVINVALLFALSQFVVVWAIALIYSRKASQDFDVLAAQISSDLAEQRQVGAAT